jgi:hypothetical protein
VPMAPFELSHSLLPLLLQHVSQGSVGMPILQADVTRAWEAATAVVATRVAMVHAAKTSA